MGVRIIGSGSFVPKNAVTNKDFDKFDFRDEHGTVLKHSNEVIARKLQEITGIEERRYIDDDKLTSDMGFYAAQKALEAAQIDPETLDYIIFAHNFGDVKKGAIQTDLLPTLAARVKHNLRIKNSRCVAYDILFGCPGWLEGSIQAKAFIDAGIAKRCLVIGAETLSRVIDLHDRDSMIYADGAGATIYEFDASEGGILAHETGSFTYEEAFYLFFGKSYNPDLDPDTRYIKMHGRKIYEFALQQVPQAMKNCLDKSGVAIDQLKKIIIHQANEKMDEAIVSRFYKLYDKEVPENIMPMSIHMLGNSSVATLPTLFDMIMRKEMIHHQFEKGDVILFASVGGGMNINAMVYQF
ncbi:3-oxoacyl-ACP synthase III family protein [Flavobacterium sp. HSC-61S13]|uniref:3-oxoacyl-ACP synthase III family protein n=1 Tax=Flavobacterium sp. HSC-61S13 TaxID=2910963 RepID=UPI00209C8702|nr:ketoacyl-ACP synthase III [Flavobacterium sp. HSC-61S13]MCP1994844.1 3-oxoacyl-[acyl-carrier-protein] synthase-3 [Flavobacterium sp. HSC-61S13]